MKRTLEFRSVSTAAGDEEWVIVGDSEDEAFPETIRVSHEILCELLLTPTDRLWLEDGADELHVQVSNGSAVYGDREAFDRQRRIWQFQRLEADLKRPIVEATP